MKIPFLIPAILTLSLGTASAFADPGPLGPTMFTAHEVQSERQAHPWHYAPKPQVVPGGAPTYLYSAPQNRGTWLFPPHENEGTNG